MGRLRAIREVYGLSSRLSRQNKIQIKSWKTSSLHLKWDLVSFPSGSTWNERSHFHMVPFSWGHCLLTPQLPCGISATAWCGTDKYTKLSYTDGPDRFRIGLCGGRDLQQQRSMHFNSSNLVTQEATERHAHRWCLLHPRGLIRQLHGIGVQGENWGEEQGWGGNSRGCVQQHQSYPLSFEPPHLFFSSDLAGPRLRRPIAKLETYRGVKVNLSLVWLH